MLSALAMLLLRAPLSSVFVDVGSLPMRPWAEVHDCLLLVSKLYQTSNRWHLFHNRRRRASVIILTPNTPKDIAPLSFLWSCFGSCRQIKLA